MLDKKENLQMMGYYGLVDGVNVNCSSIMRKKTQLIESVNVTSGKLGVLSRSPLRTKYNSAAVVASLPFLGGCIFKDASGVAHKIVAMNKTGAANSAIYEVGTSGGTLKKDTLTASKTFDFVTLLDYLMAINETDGVMTTKDLTTWGTVNAVSAPKGKFIEEFNNEPYIAGNPSFPNRVYKGFLHNPAVMAVAYVTGDQTSATTTVITVDETKYLKAGMKIDIYERFTTTRRTNGNSLTIVAITSSTTFTIASTDLTLLDSDEIYLEDTRTDAAGTSIVNVMSILWDTNEDNFDLPPNGEQIIGMRKNSGRLVVFQENSMHRWDGSQNIEVSPTVGCSSDKGIISVGNLLFWMHKGVIYFYDGSEPQACSELIEPILSSMTTYNQCVGISDDANKRIAMYLGDISCPELVGTDVWAVYYYKQDKWEFVKGIPASIYFKDNSGTGSAVNYVGDKAGFLWKFLDGFSEEAPYRARSGYDCQEQPSVEKEYRYITTFSEKPGGKLYYAVDFSNDYKCLGEITEINQTFSIPMGKGFGTFISVMWADNTSNERPEFLGYEVFFSQKGIK